MENGPRVKNGGVAQLGEHLLCKQGVIGSIPFISTTLWQERAMKPFTGSKLRWLERTPDKREVGGSSPLEPTRLRKAVIEIAP